MAAAANLEATAAPVSLAELKQFLRIGTSEEDALLAGLVRTASELCEGFTRLALIEREVEERLAATGVWTRLALAPVRAILGVSMVDDAGAATPLAAGSYAVDIDASGEGWVRTARSSAGARLLVRYRAGQAAEWNGVPEALRQGVVRMAAHLYTHRDREDGRGPPAAATALWLPYRRLRLR
jgi:uncharacterized phiE125 gp8 family phage protein